MPAPIRPQPITVTFFSALWFEDVLKSADIAGNVLQSGWLLASRATGTFAARKKIPQAAMMTQQRRKDAGDWEKSRREVWVFFSGGNWGPKQEVILHIETEFVR